MGKVMCAVRAHPIPFTFRGLLLTFPRGVCLRDLSPWTTEGYFAHEASQKWQGMTSPQKQPLDVLSWYINTPPFLPCSGDGAILRLGFCTISQSFHQD